MFDAVASILSLRFFIDSSKVVNMNITSAHALISVTADLWMHQKHMTIPASLRDSQKLQEELLSRGVVYELF